MKSRPTRAKREPEGLTMNKTIAEKEEQSRDTNETEGKAESEKKTTKNVLAVLNDKAELDCDGEEQKRI
jgi:hypothetical protein